MFDSVVKEEWRMDRPNDGALERQEYQFCKRNIQIV